MAPTLPTLTPNSSRFACLQTNPTQAPKAEGVYHSHTTQPASYLLGQSRETHST